MRIVQTFWTDRQSLLENSFGWINPQFHLMSWALSCLSLRKNYDEVVLYTDSEGYRVFIELLKLPYTEVVVQYDGLQCPRPHWAYPKMLTYSLQKKPFVHVDGDLYIPHRLDKKIEQSGLIAQNVETGTGYYHHMMGDILRRGVVLPDFLTKELERDSIRSYNAGVLGGNDLDFIQEYCRTAFRIIEENRLLEEGNLRNHVNNNLLYEQVLFFALADRQGKSVASVIDRVVPDNGYCYADFCDLYRYDQFPMLHILGGYKRNPRICKLLGRTLLDRYPEYYRRILNLFADSHQRLRTDATPAPTPDFSVQMCLAFYQDHLEALLDKWKRIPTGDLYEMERRISRFPAFLNASVEEQQRFTLRRNPYVDLFKIPQNWPEKAKTLLKEQIEGSGLLKQNDIACVPTLLDAGYKEWMLNDLDHNVLMLLKHERTYRDLYTRLLSLFSSGMRRNEAYVDRLIRESLEKLSYNGLIYVKF